MNKANHPHDHKRDWHLDQTHSRGPNSRFSSLPSPFSSRPSPFPPLPSDVVYGRQPVLEALKAGKRSLHKIWILPNAGGPAIDEIMRLARARGVPVTRGQTPGFFRSHKGSDPAVFHHQGVVAQAAAATFVELDQFLEGLKLGTVPTLRPMVVALDEIEDPHNVGAILRSAGFFGVSAVLLPRWRSAPVGETAARVSSGAIEHLTLIRVRNLADAILQLKEAGFYAIGADMSGEDLRTLGSDPDLTGPGPLVLVLGSEGKGIRRLVRERCDRLVAIRRRGPVESLNVGAAAAIFLDALCRPR